MLLVRGFKTSKSLLSLILAVITVCGNICFTLCAVAFTNVVPSMGSNQVDFTRTSKFFKENCTCSTELQCACCAKVNNDLLNLHRKLCFNWTISSDSWDIQAIVRLNENVLYTNTFSAWNIPPFCVLIWPAIALTGCIQMHSVTHHEFNTLHGCANLTINFVTFSIINFPMGCMHFGMEGIYFVDANHANNNATSAEKPPEIEFETNDFAKSDTPPENVLKNMEDIKGTSSAMRVHSLSYVNIKHFSNFK